MIIQSLTRSHLDARKSVDYEDGWTKPTNHFNDYDTVQREDYAYRNPVADSSDSASASGAARRVSLPASIARI